MTLREATELLRAAGIESPEHDAKELFILATGSSRYKLLSPSLDCELPEFTHGIERRAAREPLQYIIGTAYFYRESYKVTPSVLIPRNDTEVLVDYAVRNIPEGEDLIDICTGSGCIAISTLKNTSGTRALALDISGDALDIAKENAEANGVKDRIKLLRADALSFIPSAPVYAILSNPPYVTESEYMTLAPELSHEPRLALVGGDEGLEFYKKITANCRDKIKDGGFIAFEIGRTQGEALRAIAEESSLSCEIIKDLSALDRVAVLRKK